MSTEPAPPTVDGLLVYCRAGFEPEAAAELSERAAIAGFPGYARTERGAGYVQFLGVEDGAGLAKALPWSTLIFARQKLRLLADVAGMDPKDRIAPIMEALGGRGRHGDLWVEHPDSDEGKPLAGLARSFGNALRPALRKRGMLTDKEDPRLPRLHVLLLAGDHALLGSADPKDASPWPLGVPRLRAHADAPSRSALKLEEAFLTLLTEKERAEFIRPGMFAADLGAAPGGWSWVLARHHVRVFSVDNGPMAQSALDMPVIEHIRADGFRWQPPKPLDWMVCDMVESPRKVADRMATWFREGWCRHAVFNLKLPMKKRWDETRDCLQHFVDHAGRPLTIRAKQLYHDREEVTVYAG